jgi:hypothetical protein
MAPSVDPDSPAMSGTDSKADDVGEGGMKSKKQKEKEKKEREKQRKKEQVGAFFSTSVR